MEKETNNASVNFERVREWMGQYKSLGIAYSGGVDSSLLVAIAVRCSTLTSIAYTIFTSYTVEEEMVAATALTRDIGSEHKVLPVDFPESIRNNPPNRCYLCKQALFNRMVSEVKDKGIEVIIDGTNADDIDDNRPGIQALHELGVKSPFLELGITKKEIRQMSCFLNLPTANKPANPCLLTRFPVNTELTLEKINQVAQSERYLHDLGFMNVRVRHHDQLARIEVAIDEFDKILSRGKMLEIYEQLHNYGYKFVAVDCSGYKTGNMNG